MKLPKRFNKKIVIFSLIALGFLYLTFFVNPYFVVGAIICVIINQRELMKK